MDDLYQDNIPAGTPATAETAPPENTTPPAKEKTDEEKSAESSALLPRSLVGTAKAGETITLKVVKIYEDEVEVEPVSGGKSTSDEEIEALDDESEEV